VVAEPLVSNILLVDDQPANLLALSAVLEPLGQRLVKAASGQEALAHLQREEFALVLLDVRMPGLDGFETARLIRQRGFSRPPPIFFITASHGDEAHVRQGYAQGAADYILKPFDPDILRTKVSVFVDLYLQGERLKQQAQVGQQSLLRAQTDKRIAETFARLGLAFASELDRGKLLQRITDEATELTGAAFGAFFHQVDNELGESYLLYTLSGVPREAFNGFPMPRNTRVFGPTFEGKGTVRMDDVTQSPEFGHNPPYHGMPKGHLPVKSYLAVPVKSRSGAVLGGLFFGHPEPGRFREEHERLVEGLAAQAAVALDNSQLYQQAQLAVSLRDEFLQVAAHELRTPTTSLKLHVQSLLRASNALGPTLSVEKLRDKLEGVEKITGKLSALIDTLLDISRISAGSLHLNWEEVDLTAVSQEVASRFEAQASQAHSPIQVIAHAPVVGRWDRLRLEQIVTNLLSNAIKYGAGKPVHLEVSVVGAHARLIVRDQGIGIAPEALPRLFGRFERAVSQRHYSGLGLGLYITRQVVEALGGTIRVESQLNRGATFTVEFPLRGAEPSPETPRSPR
jgi:signal transduction histidine kinase/DNA-binding NarL/FixJ family response regulator